MERIQRRHRHVLLLARTDGPEEKVPFVAQIGRWVFDGDRFALAHLAVFVGEKAFVADVKAFGSKETVAAVAAVGLLERAQDFALRTSGSSRLRN